jgi:hypothetical protein
MMSQQPSQSSSASLEYLPNNWESLTPELQQAVENGLEEEKCAADVWYWLRHHTNTRDDHCQEKGTQPYARFPDKPYFPYLFYLLRTERRLFLPKSREMGLSWAIIADSVYMCQWNPNTHVIVQSATEDKSIDLVVGKGVPGYARVLWEQQDQFLKDIHPVTKNIDDMPGSLLSWTNGSSIRGVPSGANQVRQYHPARLIMDEAAFLPEAAASYDAAEAVTIQVIVVSSAASSWFGDRVQRAFDKARYRP